MQVHALGHRELIPCMGASVSTGETNSDPVRTAASSVGGNRRRFEVGFAAASNVEVEDGEVRLSPPSEARIRRASGGES